MEVALDGPPPLRLRGLPCLCSLGLMCFLFSLLILAPHALRILSVERVSAFSSRTSCAFASQLPRQAAAMSNRWQIGLARLRFNPQWPSSATVTSGAFAYDHSASGFNSQSSS
jgi:hypothetical protein